MVLGTPSGEARLIVLACCRCSRRLQSVSGNAAKSGIKAGDTIIYASSFFGDELWPTDKLSFTQTAIQRAPSPVAFVYVRTH